jgi:hypothetical protein
VRVTGVHHAEECMRDDKFCSPWADEDVRHVQVTDPRPLTRPVPCRGRLGLWEVPTAIATRVGDQITFQTTNVLSNAEAVAGPIATRFGGGRP